MRIALLTAAERLDRMAEAVVLYRGNTVL
jgi:hypothetical protein